MVVFTINTSFIIEMRSSEEAILFLFCFIQVCSNGISEHVNKDENNKVNFNNNYRLTYGGEKFPKKYLKAENVDPTLADLDHYLNGLTVMLFGYWSNDYNHTDNNRALGVFLMKANLKRTLQDYGDKMYKRHTNLIKKIINIATEYVSHYVYEQKHGEYANIQSMRVADLLIDDAPLIHSLGTFKKNRLQKFILYQGYMNDYIEEIDAATLPKKAFIELFAYDDYFVPATISDDCFLLAAFEPVHGNLSGLRPCKRNVNCVLNLYSSPSVAYGLSHRMLNIFVYRNMRRCYLVRPEFDAFQLEMLCAFMYREAVYIARRGFFSRDMFLEHIGLCGLLGYEEFYRRNWFYKAVSWIDRNGCVAENLNHEINRTAAFMIKYRDNPDDVEHIKNAREEILNSNCHLHPMALMVEVLGMAIRQAAYYVTRNSTFV